MSGETYYIDKICEFVRKKEFKKIGSGVKGIYALLQKKGKKAYSVVYIGMSTTSIRARIKSHIRSRTKVWSHFSVFKVKGDISSKKIKELEGLFRHIYRKDKVANVFNNQKRYGKFRKITTKKIEDWLK